MVWTGGHRRDSRPLGSTIAGGLAVPGDGIRPRTPLARTRLFGETTRIWVAFFYVATLAGLVATGALAGTRWPCYLLLVPAAGHLCWQLVTLDIDDPERCRRMFVANRVFGWIVLAAVLAGRLG